MCRSKETCYKCGDNCAPSLLSVAYNFLWPIAQVACAAAVVINVEDGIKDKHWSLLAAAIVVFFKAITEDASAVSSTVHLLNVYVFYQPSAIVC